MESSIIVCGILIDILQMTEAIGWTGEHSYDVPVGIVEIACGAFAGKHSLFSVFFANFSLSH